MKMENFFSHFYNNEFAFYEHQSKNPLIREFTDRAETLKQHFKETLSEEDFERLRIFEHQFESIQSLEKEDSFAYGFSVAVLMMVEVLGYKDEVQIVE